MDKIDDIITIPLLGRFWNKVKAFLLGELEEKANDGDLTAHVDDKENPHGVTKAQLGLDKVNNTADSAKTVKHAGTADSATKATQDANGNVITDTYATKQELASVGISIDVETFTASDSRWGSAVDGFYPLTIATDKCCLGVYEQNENDYVKVEVGITMNGTNTIVYAPAKFGGRALFV